MITRGTSPTLTFNLGFDLTTVQDMTIIFSQNEEVRLAKSLTDLTSIDRQHGIVVLDLFEYDTAELEAYVLCHIRIRVTFIDGKILVSKDMQTDVEDYSEEYVY